MKNPSVIISPVDHNWRTVARTAVSWATLKLGLSEKFNKFNKLSEKVELMMAYAL
jgi:hypothetical protein